MAMVESPAGLTVLVVSDGVTESEATRRGLDKLGWRPWHMALSALSRGDVINRPPDAVLVAMSGSMSAVVQALQTLIADAPGVPIIVLTDDLGVAEQVLFVGACAVLPAMARTSLVHAQLRAALRQTASVRQHGEPSGVLRVRALRVDTLGCEVTVHHQRLDLTPTEYRILATLVKYAGRALGADFLLRQSSELDIDPAGAREVVKVHVARLRRKLREATGENDYIVNVRNVGYLLERRRRGSARE